MQVKLNVAEVIQFNMELQDLLLEEEINFGTKWDLVQLQEKTSKVVKRFTEQRLKIFEKYGKCTDKKNQTWTFTNQPKEETGKKEVQSLLDKTENFVNNLNISDFKGLKSKALYIQIMKFFK